MTKKTLADQMAAATKATPKSPMARKSSWKSSAGSAEPKRGRGGHLVANRRSFPKRITLDLSIEQNDYLRDQGIDLGGSKAEVLRALIGELRADQNLRDRVASQVREDRRDRHIS